MLHIYTDKKFMPKDIEFVFDADAYFLLCRFDKSDFIDGVLDYIECAKYLDNKSFIDRFGYKVYSNNLSTTSKILIDIYEFPNKCINAVEMGCGGYDILPKLNEGYVYVESGWEYLAEVMASVKKSCELNGRMIVW